MKSLNNIKVWVAAVLGAVLIVGGCMTIEEIIHPEDAKVNQEIPIQVKIKMKPETDQKTQLIFAVLAPKSWNIASNAQLTLTTTGYTLGGGNVKDEPLTLVPATETEFTTAKPWAAAFQSTVGLMGNFGPVEWVVFQSSTKFEINDQGPDKEVIGTIKIRLKTGPQAIKLYMGYTFCGKEKGFDGEKYKVNATPKVLTVTGGVLPMLDYTKLSLVSTVPATFGYGDIFSVVFEEKETPLKGAEQIFLNGKVIYDGGQVKEITTADAKTLMEKIGETTRQRYIYPKEFFGLPSTAIIEKVYVRFSNADHSIVVKDGEEDFLISESKE